MRINHAIKILITSDFLINAGMSVFAPVFAVFVTKQVAGGSVEVVGFAAAISQIVKSILEIPIARYLDRNHGEYDDFYSMVSGSCLIALSPFLYYFATETWHVYAIAAEFGLGLALTVPPWFAIFTRHIDKLKENVEWSLESISIGIGSAAASALSGIIATNFGFRSAFLIAGCIAFLGAMLQIKVYSDLRAHVRRGTVKAQPDKTA